MSWVNRCRPAARRDGVARAALALVLVLCGSLPACTSGSPTFVIEHVGVSGVLRTEPAGFALVIDPCTATVVSRVELGVHAVDADGVDHLLVTVLTAVYDSPTATREVLISTSTEYVAVVGADRFVGDDEELRRFNEDHSYLTATGHDVRYFGWSAWDAQGQPLMIGDSMGRRFDADIGEVALPAYVGPAGNVTCPDGSIAWPDSTRPTRHDGESTTSTEPVATLVEPDDRSSGAPDDWDRVDAMIFLGRVDSLQVLAHRASHELLAHEVREIEQCLTLQDTLGHALHPPPESVIDAVGAIVGVCQELSNLDVGEVVQNDDLAALEGALRHLGDLFSPGEQS